MRLVSCEALCQRHVQICDAETAVVKLLSNSKKARHTPPDAPPAPPICCAAASILLSRSIMAANEVVKVRKEACRGNQKKVLLRF